MRTESSKSYRSGFVLTEAELRRIVGIMEEQLRRIAGVATVTSTFDLKYKNGALGKTTSLDEVLSQENLGSAQITELKIACASAPGADLNNIVLEFKNVDSTSKSEASPIHLAVKGDERDWTFVTSSLLEERVLRIKRRPLGVAIGVNRDWEPLVFMLALLFGFMSVVFLQSIYRPEPPYYSLDDFSFDMTSPSVSDQLHDKVRDEGINDPVQALIVREKLFEERQESLRLQIKEREAKRESRWREITERNSAQRPWLLRAFWAPFAIVLFFPILLYLFRTFLILYYPTYVFAWGDYVDVFRRKESVRKFILVFIVLGVIVSFVGGVLANSIRLAK